MGPLTNRLHLICESEKNVDQYLAPVLCADHIAWLDIVYAVGLFMEVNVVAEHCRSQRSFSASGDCPASHLVRGFDGTNMNWH